MLKVKDLKVSIENKQILKGLNLEIQKGEVHALMGQNGSGKSTFAQTLMGHPFYKVDGGTATMDKAKIFDLEPNERAKAGIFLSFQYPSEVTGVNIVSYLRMIYNKKNETNLSPIKFREFLKEKLELLEIDLKFLDRHLNEGFSGGEKKKMEMLQMLVLEPKLAVLDEVDSGLDIDAVKVVSRAVNYLNKEKQMSVLIITHYARILHYIVPNYVHIMKDGQIVESGDKNLALELEEKGYEKYSHLAPNLEKTN